jgi:excisionase family DNA binding protein
MAPKRGGTSEREEARVANGTGTTPVEAGDNVYTLVEAARLKGVSYHTASRAVRSGKLPHTRIGRMAIVAADDLAAWRPMIERRPHKYARREPDLGATPALIDLASGDRVELARQLATLLEVVHGAAMEQPLGEFLGLLCERLSGALDLDRTTLWGIDERQGLVRRLAACGEPMSSLGDELPLTEAQAFARFVETGTATVRDVREFGESPAALLGVTSLFVAPLRIGNRKLGTVQGDCGGAPFSLTEEQLLFAQALANQAALALEVARLRAELAVRDGIAA